MSYSRQSQRYSGRQGRRSRGTGSVWKIRLLIAGGILAFSAVSYYNSGTANLFTGENQRVGGLTAAQEIEIGRDAAYGMAQQHGGVSSDSEARLHVSQVGERIENVLYNRLQRAGISSRPYRFDFHLLADRRVVNAFALPGGQVFITEALYRRMTHEGQLAGVLGHEVGHVIERHGAERMAQGNFYQRVAGAAGVAGGSTDSARMAQGFLSTVGKSYGRKAELESDRWGVELMALAGYHPEHMLDVMDILKESSGGGGTPEFMSSHPKPENRQKYIREVIADRFPNGLPPGLH